jgi:endonuclease YncB( thermonuclease family)
MEPTKDSSGKGDTEMEIGGKKLLFLVGTVMALVILTSPVYGASDRLPKEGTRHPSSEQVDSRHPVKVLEVLSGDTLLVMYEGRRTVVRLRGVTAPEKGEPRCQEAVNLLRRLLKSKSVELGFGSPPEIEKDDRGRFLAYLFADGEDVNEQMRSGGWSETRETGPAPGPRPPGRMQPPRVPPVEETPPVSTTSSPKTSTSGSADSGSTIVHITAVNKIYHRPGCRLLRDVRSVPVLKSEAIRLGYTRCRRCRP